MNMLVEELPIPAVAEEVLKLSADNENVLIEASEEFVNTPYVQALTERALTYLSVGYAVHFAGPAGTGKTTLALHVAAQLARPVMLLHGDDEFTGSDLVGRGSGYRKSRIVDNYIHSVLKTEEQMTTFWMDNRLTTACEEGYTLIYDEFNRSKAEANNTLLSVLAEGILNLPNRRQHSGGGYIQVHPQFRAIFTSNPEEYVGVHRTQDALMDRMITIDVGHHDHETEIQITRAKSGVALGDAAAIVDLVRQLRGDGGHRPTIRACIAIARVLMYHDARARSDDPVYRWVCKDVLGVDVGQSGIESTGPAFEKRSFPLRNAVVVEGGQDIPETTASEMKADQASGGAKKPAKSAKRSAESDEFTRGR